MTSPPSPQTGLSATHVTVQYGRRTVLQDVTAGPFLPGTVCALLGPNGGGKSTLMRAMAGLAPSSACVTLNGVELSRMSLTDRTARCLYLPQALPAAVHLPVLEALIAARQTTGRAGIFSASRAPEEDAIQSALESLSLFGIPQLAMQAMDELSGGQRQLVGLAQALSRKPDALLLDEPLSALDLHHQFAVMDILRRESAAHQLVTVLVLHDLNIALNMTDFVTVLHDCQMVASGPPAAVLTPDLLREVYRVHARVEEGTDGRKFVSVNGIA